MKFKILAIAFAALAVISCDNTTDEIGVSLISNMDHMQVSTDTFQVTTHSIFVDSVLSRNTTAYLGKVRDPETGNRITGNCMIQFHTLDNYSFPSLSNIVSLENGEVIADSCEIRLFVTSFYGDSLTAMKLTAYEMNKPMEEGVNYYSNFDPMANGYVSDDAFNVSKVYSITNLNDSEEDREDDDYTPNIKISLNKPYTDKNGNTYNNYGTYIMRKYYEDANYFKNSYKFIHNVVPGFYIKNTGGLGSMAYITISQLNVYFRFNQLVESSSGEVDSLVTYTGTASFAGTEEVLQTTNIENETETIKSLVADNSCTYLKTPAGIFTEMTLPVDEILNGHETDTLNTAKVVLTRINDTQYSAYSLDIPQTLLLLPADSLYSFFENKSLPNYKTSYIASYNSTYNTYTFNNISGLITAMAASNRSSANWNKCVVVPITMSTTTDSKGNTVISQVVNDMSLTSTRLVGGSANANAPIEMSVIYSKFK